MKKYIILPLLLFLTLCGCGRQEFQPPKITYSEKAAFYPSYSSGEAVPAEYADIRIAAETALHVMDEGYHADDIAAIGSTVLAADLNSKNYELVLFELDFENGAPMTLNRKVISISSECCAETEYLYGITAGEDGYFYILSGEAPRISLRKDADGEYVKVENADYCGRCRITMLSPDGIITDASDFEFPSVDCVCDIWAVNKEKLYISAAMCRTEDENFVYLDDFVLCELSAVEGVVRSLPFESGQVPTDMHFTDCGTFIAANENSSSAARLYELDMKSLSLGHSVPSIAYRSFTGKSASESGKILLPSALDFVLYDIAQNTLTPILSRSDGDTGWDENCTLIHFDGDTVICASRGAEFLTVYHAK